MSGEEILDAIAYMAETQEFYQVILEELKADPKYLDYLVKHNFKDIVDLALYFEK